MYNISQASKKRRVDGQVRPPKRPIRRRFDDMNDEMRTDAQNVVDRLTDLFGPCGRSFPASFYNPRINLGSKEMWTLAWERWEGVNQNAGLMLVEEIQNKGSFATSLLPVRHMKDVQREMHLRGEDNLVVLDTCYFGAPQVLQPKGEHVPGDEYDFQSSRRLRAFQHIGAGFTVPMDWVNNNYGQRLFVGKTKRLAATISQTWNYRILMELLNEGLQFEKENNSSYISQNTFRRKLDEHFGTMFALQKSGSGFQGLLSRGKSLAARHFTPDTVILPDGALRYVKVVREESRVYALGGPGNHPTAAQLSRESGIARAPIYGWPMYESSKFKIGNNDEMHDPMSKTVYFTERYIMKPASEYINGGSGIDGFDPERKHHLLSIEIIDGEKNNLHQITRGDVYAAFPGLKTAEVDVAGNVVAGQNNGDPYEKWSNRVKEGYYEKDVVDTGNGNLLHLKDAYIFLFRPMCVRAGSMILMKKGASTGFLGIKDAAMVFNRDANAFQLRVQARCTAGTFIVGNHQIQVMPNVIGDEVVFGRKPHLRKWKNVPGVGNAAAPAAPNNFSLSGTVGDGLIPLLVWPDKNHPVGTWNNIATDMHKDGVNPTVCSDTCDDYKFPPLPNAYTYPSMETFSKQTGVGPNREKNNERNVLSTCDDYEHDGKYFESFAVQGFQRNNGWQDEAGHSPLGDYPSHNVFSIINNNLSTEFLGHGISSSVTPRPRGPVINL